MTKKERLSRLAGRTLYTPNNLRMIKEHGRATKLYRALKRNEQQAPLLVGPLPTESLALPKASHVKVTSYNGKKYGCLMSSQVRGKSGIATCVSRQESKMCY